VGALQAHGLDAMAGSGELPLLGRGRELAELTAALEDARAGRGGLVLLAGEPGIGKTRLARALGDQAREGGAHIAWARGWDGGGAPSFWPWLQVIRALSAGLADDRLATALGAGARRVAHIAPELRDRLGVAELSEPAESEQARFALFDAVAVFLRNVAGDAPVVVLLDDIHTADLPSLLLLAFLARAIGDCPILIVTTHHEAGPKRGPEVEGVFGELSRFGRRIELRGLGDEDLRRLIAHRSGAEPSDDLVENVASVTEGNPFFSDEVVRLLVAQQRGGAALEPGAPVPLPDGVRDAIRRRLQPLSAETREALEVAAVTGRGFRVATLERASGIPRAQLLERLDEALAVQVLAEAPSQAGSFRFAHGLIRETLYNDLSAIRRARLHGAVGEALERGNSAHPRQGGAGVLELAHHFIEAAPAGDAGRALDYAERAGHEALRVLAYEQAAELFDAALRALDLTGEPDERRRGELLLARGQAEMHAGDDAARATLVDAVAIARELSDHDLLARAALSLGGFGLSPGIVDDQLVAVLEEALAAVDPADSALRARLLVRLAVAIYWCNEPDRREALVSEAVSIARRLGDPATLAYVLDQGRIATSGPDTLERELAWAHELFALAEEVGDHELAVRARVWHIDLLLELDDLPAADMAIAALDRIATDVRDPRARSYIPLHRARRALMEGRAAEAERLIDEGVKLAWSLQDSTVPILAGAQLFSLRRAQGRLGELESAVRQFADSLPAMPAWRCALAVLYLDDGREGEARRELEHLAARGFADFPRDNVWMISMALLAELCEGLQDAERAAQVQALLEPFAARNVVSPEGIFGGPVTRYLALCAAARGDWDAAREHMRAARAAAERLSLGPMLALLALDEARILARRNGPGDAEAACRLLAEARERSGALGVPVIGDKLERVERQVGAATPAGDDAAADGDPAADGALAGGPATAALRREGDVWRIEFEGRTLYVKDAKGLRHLGLLLGNPGVEFHAVDIVGAGSGPAPSGTGDARAAAAGGDLEIRREGDAGALLDTQAKREYRSRLEDLRADIEEAEAFNDPERAARAREEMAFIARELSSAVGLGGRDRRAASNAERARVNVTRAVRGAIRRIAAEDGSLGRELETTVHTGYFCRYEPDPRRPVAWQVDGG
jgi:tetratricopeptide (TPR) repeat protein